MKQFQIMYEREHSLAAWLGRIRDYCGRKNIPAKSVLFRIYSDSASEEPINAVIGKLTERFPGALYAGSACYGSIIYGSLSDTHISITCTVFEDPSTEIRILQLPMRYDSQKTSADTVLREAASCTCLRAVEMMTTLALVDMPSFCERISSLPPGVKFYGGAAVASEDVNSLVETTVFSSAGKVSRTSSVFIFLSGASLHVCTQYLVGWKGLGPSFAVTSCAKNYLLELDGKPALETYRRYLRIPEDKHFFDTAVVFPLAFESDVIPYLRAVLSYRPDGSLELSSSVKGAKRCRIAYGDPGNIMKSLQGRIRVIEEFRPDAIQIFSCVTRLMFWGTEEVSKETLPFESIAPTSGYYTSGEFLRTDGRILLHNVASVIAALREGSPDGGREPGKVFREAGRSGEKPPVPDAEEILTEYEPLSRQLAVSSCLAHFINAMTEDLL